MSLIYRMPIDFSGKSVEQLEALLSNYARAGRQGDAVFLAATEELARRESGEFSLDKSVNFIRQRAKIRSYLSYGELAEHHGIPWNKARRPINLHLDRVCAYAHGRGWPLISSIVVNGESLDTGRLEPTALDGFVKAAVRLHIPVPTNYGEFLTHQQHATFDWAQGATP